MGATPWQIRGEYHTDPETALSSLQHRYFEQHYQLEETITAALTYARACVDAVSADDEYGLLETYTAILNDVQSLAAGGIPNDIDGQILLLRRIVNATGEPLNDILDLRGVSDRLQEWHVVSLTDVQQNEFFQTLRPTSADVNATTLGPVYSLLDRAQAVVFPIYRDREDAEPSELMYVGYTAD